MFKFSESVPTDFPGTTITGQTVGPVVWGTHKVADVPAALVAFNRLEFWELVKVGLPLLDPALREDLVRLAGGYTDDQQQAALDAAAVAEADAESARADLDRLAEQIAGKLAKVIDLDAEREKRRPGTVTAA